MIFKNWRLPIIAALLLMLSPALGWAQVSVSVSVAPPELPVYDQPPLPGDGYIWTPGYWAWDDQVQDYYWVPGAWVEAPQPDYLWTPGYWGAEGDAFIWHAGYWGPTVGFYGGVDYGYGYGGHGYEGGYWRGGHLFYNRAVLNLGSAHVTNVYNKTVVNNVHVARVSFNGGRGGVRAEPTAAEAAAARGRHIEETSAQREQVQTARGHPELRAKSNHGHLPVAATARAGNFSNPIPARNAATPARNAPGAERAAPRPRLSTPRPAPEHTATPAREARPSEPGREAPAHEATPRRETAPAHEAAPPHEATPRREAAPAHEAAPPHEATPRREAAPAHEAAPPHEAAPRPALEPRREPAHTQAPKPVPKPQARPAPKPAEQHPADHPAEHPDDREHH
jgi:hypothetical protein